MPVYLAQVRIPYDTGIPSDVAVNTFHFENRSGDFLLSTDFTAISNALRDVYNLNVTFAGSTDRIATWLSTLLNPALAEVRIYSLSDPKPRVPRHLQTIPIDTGQASTPLPTEVAIVGSFQGPAASGVPQRRRRGRVFFGPWGTGVLASSGGRPEPAARNVIAGALNRLRSTSSASTAWRWGVFSRVGNSLAEVTNGWVDNSFDTQRRRGDDPTTRVTYP